MAGKPVIDPELIAMKRGDPAQDAAFAFAMVRRDD
jgi:hypothetical protein